MNKQIHKDVLPQLEKLELAIDKPIIITDADEVLFNFMKGLEQYLEDQEMFFDWASFALSGNIRHKKDQQPIAQELIPELLDRFFNDYADRLPAVDGAADSLERLSKDAQVVVLSNVPPKYAEKRLTGLQKNGMHYPLIANVGAKGHVVKHLTDNIDHPAFFIDDIPHNHESVAKHADHVTRLHYIADERLAKLLGKAEDSHARLDSWDEIEEHIKTTLNRC